MGTLNAQQKHRAVAAEVVWGGRGAFLEEEAAPSCVLIFLGSRKVHVLVPWAGSLSGLYGPHDPAAQQLHITEEQS